MHPTRAARPGGLPRALALCLYALLGVAGCATAQAPNQDFPRSALEIRSSSGRQWFDIRIADTEARQEQGLMFVRSLPSDEGMLFPQPEPRVMSMWMKNTFIPLDLLFIDAGGRIVCLLEQTKPQSLDILTCDKPVKAVLEINGGEARKRSIRVGDRVVHSTFSSVGAVK